MNDMSVKIVYPLSPDEDIIHAPVELVEDVIREMKELRFDSGWGTIRFKFFQTSTNFGANLDNHPREALIQFEPGYFCREHRRCKEKRVSCRNCSHPDTPINITKPMRERLAKGHGR